MNTDAQNLRGRFRRAARLAGGLALEIPDTLTEEQRIAMERCAADIERVLARAALTLGVEVVA